MGYDQPMVIGAFIINQNNFNEIIAMPNTISQPLPQDLCDRSFRGMDCEGWDFSGRDIRGCDFSNAVLNSADFTGAIDFFSMDRTFEGCLFSSIAMVFYIAFTFVQEAIKVFREAIGTNFQGAILSNANFSDAKLDNCKFDRADISDVNWRGVKGVRSTIDFNNMQ